MRVAKVPPNTFTNTGETRHIRHHITCNSTNLTYMIECKKCNKQYIGETKRTLRERFRNTDKPQIIHFTLTPRQVSLPTSIYLATLLQTWVLSHLNYNLHPAHPARKHEKLTSCIEVKQYHQTESGTDGMNTDHSNLNVVCITSALHPIYMYTVLFKFFFL